MVTRRLTGAWAGLLVAAVALGACTGDPGATDAEIAASEADEERFAACADLVADVTETVQEFVDQFAPAAEQAGEGPDGTDETDVEFPSVQDLQDAAERFGQRRAALGCSAREFQVLLGRAVEDLQGRGPFAQAVVAQIRDQLLPIDGPPESVTVEPGEDLAAAIHGAGPGALVQLEPGRHELAEPLVLLRSSRVVGAGQDRTTIVSTAPGTALLHAGAGPLRLEGLTVVHEGEEAASVVVVAEGGYDLRNVVVRGGVADEAGGSGWGLVLGLQRRSGTTDLQRLVDVRASGNDAGGLMVGADRAPVVDGLEADENGGCGICFSGTARGRFTGLRLHDNALGVVLAGESAPGLDNVDVNDNADAGIVAEGATAATVRNVRVTGNGPAGVVLRGSSTVQLERLTITDHGEAGLLVEGAGAPDVADVQVNSAPVGILVRGEAMPRIEGVVIADVADAHLVWGADAGGRVAGTACEDDAPGLVLLERADPELGDDVCAVIDQRDP